MFALIDCNNFYASCERLFRPDIRYKAIVVLSNNDGCVIARSNEARALGIKMGVPFYQIKALCQKHQVVVFSSNYTLYGDISQRVMSVILDEWPASEIYSIDEAFLDLSTLPLNKIDDFCSHLQKKILQWTGIPTSIGIGPTKTLAKLGNFIAKRKLGIPVFNITQERHWLAHIPVEEVWGIGRQWAKKLIDNQIITAQDLASMNPAVLKKQYSVVMARTVFELQGVACAGLAPYEPRQNILASKSFSTMQTEYQAISQAISSHCARAVEKLRQQQLQAQYVYVFLKTNKHRQDLGQFNQGIRVPFIQATDDIRLITKMALRALKTVFRSGYHYKKVGIGLEDLLPKAVLQYDLFNQIEDEELARRNQFMAVFDAINTKFGRHTVRLASEGFNKPWDMRAELKSPCYTTRWNEFLCVSEPNPAHFKIKN